LRFSSAAKACASKLATMAMAVRVGSAWVDIQTSEVVELVTKLGALGNLSEILGVRKQPETGGCECGERSPALVKPSSTANSAIRNTASE